MKTHFTSYALNATGQAARHEQGFTLIELIVSITILAILLGIGVPSFTNVIRSNQITAQTNALVSSLTFARSEATKRSARISICGNNAGTCSGNTNWSGGWLVITDQDGDGAIDAGTDTLLQASNTPPSGIVITVGNTALTYSANGESTAQTVFSIKKNGCGTKGQRNITVELSGRIHLDKVDC